jgi:O-antigen ligase
MRLVGIAIILAFLPLCIVWLRGGVAQRRLAYLAIGVLPFSINTLNLDVALIDWSMWPGYVKGAILSVLDMLALAIVITHRRTRVSAWLLGPLILYIAAVAASIAASNVATPSALYLFQLARVLLLTIAVATAMQDASALRYLGWGLSIGIIIQAGASLLERAQGVTQAAGTMGHQNLLGMMTHFVLFPLLGLIFAGERSKVIMVGACASIVVIALSGSRATIGFAGAGIVLFALLSLARKVTAQKLRIVGGGAVAVAIAGAAATMTLSERMRTQDSASSNAERVAFARAAHMMIDDHPFGIGANQYVVVANTGGYSQRAGVNWNSGSRATNVHNFYLLTRAELGLAGAFAFILLIISAIAFSIRQSWADRRDARGEVALGIAVALTVAAFHHFFEWIFVMAEVQYVFAISIGMAGGLAASRRTKSGRSRPSVSNPRVAVGGSRHVHNSDAGQDSPPPPRTISERSLPERPTDCLTE